MNQSPSDKEKPALLTAIHKVPLLSLIFRHLNPRQKEMLSLLEHTPVFSDLSKSELTGLLDLLHERTFVQGETIFKEGEPGTGFYVIFKGEVEIGNTNSHGKGSVACIGPGEVFGEVSFLDGGGRSATATATMKTELVGFYRTELFNLLQHKPALASKILFSLGRQMSLRMRAMLQRVQS